MWTGTKWIQTAKNALIFSAQHLNFTSLPESTRPKEIPSPSLIQLLLDGWRIVSSVRLPQTPELQVSWGLSFSALQLLLTQPISFYGKGSIKTFIVTILLKKRNKLSF